MEAKNEDIEVLPQPINLRDAEAAIINLTMQNQVFEDRFISIGEALAQITSGMKELQNSVKDLVFNRQNSAINEKKQDSPPDPVPDNLIRNNKSTVVNPLQRTQQQPSRFQRFLTDRRNEQSRAVQVLSPIFFLDLKNIFILYLIMSYNRDFFYVFIFIILYSFFSITS